ncbi:uncharacterized protein LOC130715813 [Lotus japonicus]|uniref:uncharacterized protein LOC130715813 n=1 Tax=Lotus japonicus TaxID=34305 RepID=UPI0025892ACC|nr:uncharacterized protein LOC130715813 [Lotus japonicus]
MVISAVARDTIVRSGAVAEGLVRRTPSPNLKIHRPRSDLGFTVGGACRGNGRYLPQPPPLGLTINSLPSSNPSSKQDLKNRRRLQDRELGEEEKIHTELNDKKE